MMTHLRSPFVLASQHPRSLGCLGWAYSRRAGRSHSGATQLNYQTPERSKVAEVLTIDSTVCTGSQRSPESS